ncbi:MAG: redoxin family protein [Myxococcota bacterium]
MRVGIRWVAVALAFALAAAGCDDGGTASSSFEPPDLGDPMPAVTIARCDSQPLDLSAWIGGYDVVYVTFGAKWCTNCAKEAPIINSKVVDRFTTGRVGVAQILIEEEPNRPPTTALCSAWGGDIGARFDIFVDPQQLMVPQHFGEAVGGTLPVHLIVSRDGTIRFRKVGDIPDDIGDRIADWLP